MVAIAHAEGEADEEPQVEHADPAGDVDVAHEPEPETNPPEDEAPEQESSVGPDSDSEAAEVDATDAPSEVGPEVEVGDDAQAETEVMVDKVEEEGEEEPIEVKKESVELEGVVEKSKTAGLESDNGATSACFSFSTVILSTLIALKFAH